MFSSSFETKNQALVHSEPTADQIHRFEEHKQIIPTLTIEGLLEYYKTKVIDDYSRGMITQAQTVELLYLIHNKRFEEHKQIINTLQIKELLEYYKTKVIDDYSRGMITQAQIKTLFKLINMQISSLVTSIQEITA